MTGVLQQYARGVDFSGANVTPAQVKASPFGFVVRYSAGAFSHDSSMQWKLCGVNELRDFVKAGVDFIAVDESSAGRVTQGYSAGLADGKAVLPFWKHRGYAYGGAIFASWDEGQPNAALHDEVIAYLRGFGKGLAGYYNVGLYAGDVVIRAALKAGVIVAGWRAEAESWSNDEPVGAGWYQPGRQWKQAATDVAKISPAAFWQNGNVAFSNGADEDVVLRTFRYSHFGVQGSPTPPPPTPTPTPTPKPKPPKVGSYTVQPNDTLSGIAAHFHTSVSALVRLNAEAHPSLRFNPDRLIIGWKLKVHGTPVRVAQKSYTVKQNDTLGKIAGKFHTSVTQLIAWNVHEHPTLRHHADHIEAGWKLRVS